MLLPSFVLSFSFSTILSKISSRIHMQDGTGTTATTGVTGTGTVASQASGTASEQNSSST